MALSLNYLPGLRCDRGVAQVDTKGCVFPEAAPSYVLKTSDSAVSEAAEQLREAQALGSPGKFLFKPQTRAFVATSDNPTRDLQRLKDAVEFYRSPNRVAACGTGSGALINTCPRQASAACSPCNPACECDEYPFNFLWQGFVYEPDTTSVKS